MKNFVVYRSSAGSGKTFTLVREFLRLSLCDEKKLALNYKNILAITFTNKAAAEMKSRVIDALDKMASPDELPLIGKLLCEELSIDAGTLRKRARTLLSQILHHYSDLSIGTIDSFTHRIVKTFAFDLKLPINFNIELDTQGFYEKVVASLFNRIGDDELVGKLLKEFALSKAEANTAWDPEKQLQEFSSLLLKENAGDYIEKLRKFTATELEDFRKQFMDYIRHYDNTLKLEAQKALNLIAKNNLGDEDFYNKKNGPQNFFNKCFKNTVTLEDTNGVNLNKVIESGKWAGKSPNAGLVESISRELTALALTLQQFVRQNYGYYALCKLLSKQMYPLMLIKKIEEISAEQKEEGNLVFISEFNQKIFDIIQNEPTPFIYERLGERYHHYLIDEFQDTSSLQWLNVLPLIDNSLSSGWFNLLVGDGKQSIYRWRNASVKQFALLPKIEITGDSAILRERENALSRNFEQRLLNTNYRSEKTIIEFNNDLFEQLSTSKLLAGMLDIYSDHAQQTKSGNDAARGYVTVKTSVTERDQLDEATCADILEQIRRALEDGYEYRDICILPRRNNDGNTIATFLTQHQIPVISSDSLLLKNNLEVNTLLSYLRYLVNDRDEISAAAVVNYLFACEKITQQDLHRYLSQLSNRVPLAEILKSCSIHLSQSELLFSNLLDNCIEIVKALNLNLRANSYIRFFLDEVNEFLIQKNSNPALFLDWWQVRSSKASLIIPEGINAVKIMTIHASKGLEFPVVIVPYCNWPVYRAGDTWVEIENEKIKLPVTVVSLSGKAAEAGFEKELQAEQQEQLLDNLNLLYVAFTRAAERLHIIANLSGGNTRETVAGWLKDYVVSKTGGQSGSYELGKRDAKQKTKTAMDPKGYELKPLRFNAGKNTVQIKTSYFNNSEPAAGAKKQGILVHWLLSKIRVREDIPHAFRLASAEGLMLTGEQNDLLERVNTLVTHPELKAYFDAQVDSKNEAELVTHGGEILRPDKVVFESDQVTIIDYKTGKPDDSRYFQQLASYENALRTMGHKNIKKLLVYVDEAKVVELK